MRVCKFFVPSPRFYYFTINKKQSNKSQQPSIKTEATSVHHGWVTGILYQDWPPWVVLQQAKMDLRSSKLHRGTQPGA